MTALIVYVDDIIVTKNDAAEVAHLKESLAKEFEIKDFGSLQYFLGIEVAKAKQGIFLSQMKYVLDLLKESSMEGYKPCPTPIEVNHRLKEDDGERLIDVGRFQRLVGSLICMSLTWPDITFAVNVISQFMHAPTQDHMEAVYKILRYLKGCLGMGILYKRHGHHCVEIYTDIDWAGSLTDLRSTFGYCSLVLGWITHRSSVYI